MEKTLKAFKKIIPKPFFGVFQPSYHFLLALTGNIVYGFPGYKMTVIGVTGTNGKSTTCEILTEILKTGSEKKVGLISTVSIEIAGERVDNETNRTTLGRWKTHKLMREMVKRGCKYAVIEVASEGIAWHRIFGIPFDGAVFTCLAPEHLNYHKTIENYRNTKGKLFKKLSSSFNFKKTTRISVINADDKEAKYFESFPADKKYLFGVFPLSSRATVEGYPSENNQLPTSNFQSNLNEQILMDSGQARMTEKGLLRLSLNDKNYIGIVNVQAKNIKLQADETEFEIDFDGKKHKVKTKALGRFNVYNELAAFCVGLGYGLDTEKMIKVLDDFGGTRGRAEKIDEGQNYQVIIDYAVTPDAQQVLYESLREITKGKLISVFGARGDRDKGKRQEMGRVASELTDTVFITDDETYTEDSETIIEEIYSGVDEKKKNKVKRISDRLKATTEAIKLAKEGDTVVITGIGHQKFRNMGGKKIPWDERQIVKQLIREIVK